MNCKSRFAIPHALVISLVLFASLAVLPRHAVAQTNQEDKKTCEEMKKQLKDLQQALVDLAVELEALQKAFDIADQGFQTWKNSPSVKKVLQSSWYTEEFKGKVLEGGRKWLEYRTKFKEAIEKNKETTQATKDTIADLLNKLGDCGAKKPDDTTKLKTPPEPPSEKEKIKEEKWKE